jgi:hypothetical protein
MSGVKFYKQLNLLREVNRRSFLLRAGLLSSGIFLSGCLRKINPSASSYGHIKGSLKGPDSKAGHILRDKTPLPVPTSTETVKTLIIGGGVSGLSAARWLKNNGHQNFQVLELESQEGGNSRHSQNQISPYPLGAHYITLANNHDKHLINFLTEANIITHHENGLPFYNEFALCFDPEERLLINGQWQQGLIPEFGVPDADKQQIDTFLSLVEDLKLAKGKDDKYVFDIPIDNSSADEDFRKLDKISFHSYLIANGFTSKYLRWYLEYSCKDDYGQKLNQVSAWAGLHYFASRKGKAANAESNAVLTWPEGNGYLIKQMSSVVKDHIRTGLVAYDINFNSDDKISVKVFNQIQGTSSLIIAEKVILACPQYVNNKLLNKFTRPGVDLSEFKYAPWLIANITVKGLTANKGPGLCWDNVAYGTASVGYVHAGHQSLNVADMSKVITYYLPLCQHETRVARLAAYSRSYEQWVDIILPEIEYMHPNISDSIENIELWVWGHGMISPAPGFIFGKSRENALKPIENKIFFAHTDLSGVSIFEEGFHQGVRAAAELLESYGKV